MKFINRSLFWIRERQEIAIWINRTHNIEFSWEGEPPMRAYLVPYFEDITEWEKWLKHHYADILLDAFENYAIEFAPARHTICWEMFEAFFEYGHVSMLMDVLDDPIVREGIVLTDLLSEINPN